MSSHNLKGKKEKLIQLPMMFSKVFIYRDTRNWCRPRNQAGSGRILGTGLLEDKSTLFRSQYKNDSVCHNIQRPQVEPGWTRRLDSFAASSSIHCYTEKNFKKGLKNDIIWISLFNLQFVHQSRKSGRILTDNFPDRCRYLCDSTSRTDMCRMFLDKIYEFKNIFTFSF